MLFVWFTSLVLSASLSDFGIGMNMFIYSSNLENQ